MAWIKERVTGDGDKRFVACYRDAEGVQRSAGTYSSRRAAERAANREEAKVRDGTWHELPATHVTERDPVGAGDAFNAAYLAARLDDRDVPDALKAASIAGAQAAATLGDTGSER